MLDASTSAEAAALVDAVFAELWASRGGRDPHFNERLEHAQVRFRHALRRLQAAYPGMFCGWSQRSVAEVYDWTLRLAAIGHPIRSRGGSAAHWLGHAAGRGGCKGTHGGAPCGGQVNCEVTWRMERTVCLSGGMVRSDKGRGSAACNEIDAFTSAVVEGFRFPNEDIVN